MNHYCSCPKEGARILSRLSSTYSVRQEARQKFPEQKLPLGLVCLRFRSYLTNHRVGVGGVRVPLKSQVEDQKGPAKPVDCLSSVW